MNAAAEQVYHDALRLSEAERAELAARLIESLDPEVDRGVEAAWDAEIKHRLAQLDSGEVTAVPWTEARRMVSTTTDRSNK